MQYRYVLPDVAQARGAATTALQQAQELLNALYCSTGGSTYGAAAAGQRGGVSRSVMHACRPSRRRRASDRS